MDQSSRRGYLQHKLGKPVTIEQLARMTGCSTDEASRMVQELADSGVFCSNRNGIIYSKRMVADEVLRKKARENGLKGGNPALLEGVKGHAKPRPPPSSSSSSSASTGDSLGSLTLEELREPNALLGRYRRCVAAGVVRDSEAALHQFVALACRAVHQGKKNPCGLFRTLVGGWKIGDLSNVDDVNARVIYKAIREIRENGK
jgi:DNA-binding Lrp family transcriptional regulator